MGSVSIPTDILLVISKEEDRMPNSVEIELQGVFELVVLLHIQQQQDFDIGGWRGCNIHLDWKHDMTENSFSVPKNFDVAQNEFFHQYCLSVQKLETAEWTFCLS